MDEVAARAAAVRAAYNDCFGCGLANPLGLHLDGFAVADGELTAGFAPRPDYRGFADVLHGGVVAALLDETLAWTAMLIEGTYVVTATLELKYRSPAPTNTTYAVRGRVEERRGRRLHLQGFASAGDRVVAEAKGLFLATEPVAV